MMIAQFVFPQEFQPSAIYNLSSQPCLGYLRFWEALFVFHLHLVLSSSSSLQFKTVIITNMSIHWRVHWAFQKVVLLFFCPLETGELAQVECCGGAEVSRDSVHTWSFTKTSCFAVSEHCSLHFICIFLVKTNARASPPTIAWGSRTKRVLF